MKSKFNLGDEVFFMNYKEPLKGVIKGITFVVGKFEDFSFKKEGTLESPSITYCIDPYLTANEVDCFATKEELQKELFSKL